MGNSSYSISSRSIRSQSEGYYSKGRDEIFTQSRERKAHESMVPAGIVFRESCDSKNHPLTVPIQLYLDITGSMGHIPHEMIKDGLPTMIGSLIQNGVKDAALMFGAIGDHECDRHPLQVAQFESGDEELDMWLTRTYLEGGGGGNRGESYLLAWYFAAFNTRTDAWDKRGKKGFVFTIGDEPCLDSLPMSAVKEIMGDTASGQATYSADELLAAAQEKNHVYHIFLEHGWRECDPAWKQRMGDRCIIVKDYKEISKIISDTVLSHYDVHENIDLTQSNKTNENLNTGDVTTDPKKDSSNINDDILL